MFKIGDEVQIKMSYWNKLRESEGCMPLFKDNRYIGKIVKELSPLIYDSDYKIKHPSGHVTTWSKENIERVIAENEI